MKCIQLIFENYILVYVWLKVNIKLQKYWLLTLVKI